MNNVIMIAPGGQQRHDWHFISYKKNVYSKFSLSMIMEYSYSLNHALWFFSWNLLHLCSFIPLDLSKKFLYILYKCDNNNYIVLYTVHGILQVRILEWVAFPFSRRSSQPRNGTQVSLIAGGFFANWTIREAHEVNCSLNKFLRIGAWKVKFVVKWYQYSKIL